MSKELRLIKEDFCLIKRIPVGEVTEVIQQGWNPKTGNALFVMSGPKFISERYEQERIDLALYQNYLPLRLESNARSNPSLLNKDSMASWFNRWTNLNMLPTDIGQLIITTEKVTVVSSSNSMRFKHSFSMHFK